MKKICIVAPGLLGPVTNGGIGAFCFYLAETLKISGEYEVHTLFTAKVERQTPEYWQEHYLKQGVHLHFIEQTKKFLDIGFLDISYKVFLHLKEEEYSMVFIQDWSANGFVSLQARQSGFFFQNCKFIISALSSEEWVKEGMKLWTRDEQDTMKTYCERYCVENSDILIAPTQHMYDWLVEHQWKLPKVVENIPFVCSNENLEVITTLPDYSHFCFYGRLETRKGLELFINSLLVFLKDDARHYKISFLGKNATVKSGLDSIDYIKQSLQKYIDSGQIRVEIHTDFDADEAVSYLIKTNAIAVMPSLKDNLPYVVLDCIQNKQSFITTDIGGIAEAVDPAILFEPDEYSLADKLKNIGHIDFSSLNHIYSNKGAIKQWKSFLENITFDDEASEDKKQVDLSYLLLGNEGYCYFKNHADYKDLGIKEYENKLIYNLSEFTDLNFDFIFIGSSDFKIYENFSAIIDNKNLLDEESVYEFYYNDDFLEPVFEYIPFLSAKYNTTGFGGVILSKKMLKKLSISKEELSSRDVNHIIVSKFKVFKQKQIPLIIGHNKSVKKREINDYNISFAMIEEDLSKPVDYFTVHNLFLSGYMGLKEGKYYSKRSECLLEKVEKYKEHCIVIYGFNNYGKNIFRDLQCNGYFVNAVLDRDAHKYSEFDKKKYFITEPDKYDLVKKSIYIIASDNHKQSMKDILMQKGVSVDDIIFY